MNDIVAGLEEQEGPGEEPGELEVIEISAINETTVKVVFDNGEEIETTNFEPSPLVNGTNTITFTYKGVEYEEEVNYEREIQEPRLEIEVMDEVILADGLSKTMVVARLFDEEADDENNLIVDGHVTFTTTRGDFAQPQVSFDQNGEAALQLTSEVSTKTITAYITATVTSVPGFPKYEGIVAQSQVRFAPADEIDDELNMVSMVAASASQADRINVTFSGPITKADIVKDYANATAAATDSYGFRVDGSRAVLDIRNVSDKVLELILDVEGPGISTPELRWNSNSGEFEYFDGTTVVSAGAVDEWPAASDPDGGFLRDNMKHNVSIPANKGKMVANPFSYASQSGGVNFILTDISKPWIAGVKAESQMKLIVRFSEAMSIDIAEELGATGLFKNFRIDGKRLLPIATPGSPTSGEKVRAQNENLLLVDNLEVQPYFDSKGKVIDQRHLVVIDITAWNRLAPGEYSLQASNVGDWAAMTHSANMLETQTFDFEVKADDKIPTATIEMQSPEQWLITFDMPVKLADLKADEITQVTLEDAIKIYPKDEWAKPAAERTEFELTNAASDHYQVTAVDEDGMNVGGGANGYAPGTTGINGVKRLLVEFKKDWTVEYDTDTTNVDYFHSTKNPYTVVLNHWLSDGYENVMPETVLKVSTPLDAESPTIKDAVDMKDVDPDNYTTYGKAVYVEMSEPVQLLDNTGDITTPMTESQKQATGTGIPIPTFQFHKGDTVIPGSIDPSSVPQTDNYFIVEPDTDLTAGTWTLIIRSISDDVGNTSSTVTKTFVVEEDEIVVGDTRIAWVGFDNENPASGDHDYVFVKFTKVMKSTGANGVARTTNFTLNNNPLPQGSEIIQGIKNIEGISPAIGDITNNWDGLTIKLPKTAWDGTEISATNKDFTVVFGVASNFEATDGERLAGPYTVQLNDTNLPTGGVADGDFIFEAEYLNGAASNLIDGKAVVMAEGLDTNGNGKIDRIEFNGGTIADTSTSHKILVNGVTFVSDGSSGYDAESKEVDGTITTGLTITATNGAVIVNNGNVYDKAGPQVIKAKAANLDAADAFKNGSTITITFSEAIDSSITTAVADWDDITGDELDAILAVSLDEDAVNTIANVFGDGSGGDYATGILSADGKTLVIEVEDATAFNLIVTDLTHYIYAITVAGLVDAEGNQAVDLSTSTDLTGATLGQLGNNVQIKK